MNQIIKLFKLTGYFFLSTLRSPQSLFFGFAFPLIFITIFGFLGGSSSVEIALEPGSISGDNILYQAIKSSSSITLHEDWSAEKIDTELARGSSIGASLKIIQKQMMTSETSSGVGVGVDPTKTNLISAPPQFTIKTRISTASGSTGMNALNILSGITSTINEKTNPNKLKIFELQAIEVSGRKYSTIDFVLPGQLAFSLLSTGVIGTAFSFIRLRKTLVLKRLYATPTPRWLILGARLMSALVMALFQALVIIVVGYFAFNFTLVDGFVTLLQMLGLSLLGLTVFLSFGILVSSLADSEETAAPVANIFTLPQFILSGAFFPTSAFPDWLRIISDYLPMTYLNQALRRVSFEGWHWDRLWMPISGLVVWGVLIYLVSIKLFKWE